MAKEIETIVCEVCESQYKLVYDLNETSGYPKFCPFCQDTPSQLEDHIDDDEGLENE